MGKSRTDGDQLSPDGRFRVEYDWVQRRAHHWVRSPRIVDLDSGEVLLDLWGTLWDGAAVFLDAAILLLYLQHYPGVAPALKLHLDLRTRSVAYLQDPGEDTPLDEFVPRLLNRN